MQTCYILRFIGIAWKPPIECRNRNRFNRTQFEMFTQEHNRKVSKSDMGSQKPKKIGENGMKIFVNCFEVWRRPAHESILYLSVSLWYTKSDDNKREVDDLIDNWNIRPFMYYYYKFNGYVSVGKCLFNTKERTSYQK